MPTQVLKLIQSREHALTQESVISPGEAWETLLELRDDLNKLVNEQPTNEPMAL